MALDPEYAKKQRVKKARLFRERLERMAPEERAALLKHRRERWKKNSPEKYKANLKVKRARSKARRKGAGGSFTAVDIRRIYKAQNGKCAYCRKKLGESYHIDHIMPIALGGTNDPANLQLACAPCNWSKSAKHPVDFAQSMGLLL